MLKLIFLIFLIVGSLSLKGEGKTVTELYFAYGGAKFLSSEISVNYKKINLDLYYIQQKVGGVDQKNYAVVPYYTAWNLLKNNSAAINGAIGFSVAQAFYDTTKSSLSLSPVLGVEGDYIISEKFTLDGDMFFFIYRDGVSTPYKLILDYKLSNNFKINAGIQGLNNFVIEEGLSSFFKIGGLLGIKYSF